MGLVCIPPLLPKLKEEFFPVLRKEWLIKQILRTFFSTYHFMWFICAAMMLQFIRSSFTKRHCCIGANRPGFGGSVPCPARKVLFTWNVPDFQGCCSWAGIIESKQAQQHCNYMAWELKSCQFHALCCLSSSYCFAVLWVGLSSKYSLDLLSTCAWSNCLIPCHNSMESPFPRDSFFLSLKLFFGGWHLDMLLLPWFQCWHKLLT